MLSVYIVSRYNFPHPSTGYEPPPMNAVRSPNDAHRLADHTADRRMLLLALMALAVGSGGAFGAWLLLALIRIATNLFWFGRLSARSVQITDTALGVGIVAIPVVGSVLVGLMARFGSDKIRGHGIPEAIEAILFGESRVSPRVAVLKPLSSAISIGSGGPFGAEGPIIMTGGAFGSLFAQCFHLSAAERKTLLVAGAAAGMTAIFGTPVAAVLLAVEVLLFEWKPRSFVPVAVAALVALAWRPTLIGSGPMFPFAAVVPSFRTLPEALVLGVVVGFEAIALSWLLYRIEDGFQRLPIHWMWWPALAAIVVGVGGLIDARVLGAGYASIQALLDGKTVMSLVVSLLIIKAVVWLTALGSGTSGGVLAPILILGGSVGCIAGHWMPGGDVGFWAMIGMAGIMSGALRAPLTGALFAVELTGHLEALPWTLAGSVGAYAVSVLLMRRSILTERLARRGRHVLQEYAVDALGAMQAAQLMTPSPETLPGTTSLRAASEAFRNGAGHRSYPVVDEQGLLLGLVSRDDVLHWEIAGQDDDDATRLADVVSDASVPVAYPHTPAGVVADLMVESGMGRIPIVDPGTHRVIGVLSRHDLLKVRSEHWRQESGRTRFGAAP